MICLSQQAQNERRGQTRNNPANGTWKIEITILRKQKLKTNEIELDAVVNARL
jgi:hypothetical protein